MVATLLPPNAEKPVLDAEQAMARIGAIDLPIGDFWNPQTCPIAFLPWLAWGLSIDIWNPDWTEAQKRTAVAQSLPDQAKKGTRLTIDKVLNSFDPLIDLVEWWQDTGSGIPYTFDVRLPVSELPQDKRTADFAEVILRDISMIQPVRAHMTMVQEVKAEAAVWLAASGQVAGHLRDTASMDQATALQSVWGTYIQTEFGEPILAEDGSYIEED